MAMFPPYLHFCLPVSPIHLLVGYQCIQKFSPVQRSLFLVHTSFCERKKSPGRKKHHPWGPEIWLRLNDVIIVYSCVAIHIGIDSYQVWRCAKGGVHCVSYTNEKTKTDQVWRCSNQCSGAANVCSIGDTKQ